MQTIIIFLLVLSLLVVVHEGGHFFAAKFFNMKVYEFGIGFPPRAVGFFVDPETGERRWVWGKGEDSLKETVASEESQEEFPDTLYSINWLPLGGFVRIKGENGQNLEDPDSFGYKPPWKRVIVLSAGVIMNFVLAGFLLAGGFINGLPTDASAVEDPNAIVLQEPQVMIQKVKAETPAEKAGLKMGDKILSVNDQKITKSEQLVNYVDNNQRKELDIKIERNGSTMTISAKPKQLENSSEKKLGIRLSNSAVVKYPWYIALYKGFVAAVSGTITIVVGFYMLLKNLILGNGMIFEVSGPVGIASVIGDSLRLGFSYLLNVTAMISLSLAVINILPIPALDGGRIFFVLMEKIMGKRVPERWERLAHTAGFALLMGLIIVVTYRDIIRVF